MTRHEVQVLRAVGMAQAAVAAKAGVSKASVRRIEREAPVTTSEPKALGGSIASADRPSPPRGRRRSRAGWLRTGRCRAARSSAGSARSGATPAARAPSTSWSDDCDRWRSPRWCAARAWPASSANTPSGRSTCPYTGGGRERIRFFASRLKWSRFAHIGLVPDEREEALIRALLTAFEALGGVPELPEITCQSFRNPHRSPIWMSIGRIETVSASESGATLGLARRSCDLAPLQFTDVMRTARHRW
jgi:hypothetical protein